MFIALCAANKRQKNECTFNWTHFDVSCHEQDSVFFQMNTLNMNNCMRVNLICYFKASLWTLLFKVTLWCSDNIKENKHSSLKKSILLRAVKRWPGNRLTAETINAAERVFSCCLILQYFYCNCVSVCNSPCFHLLYTNLHLINQITVCF